MPQPQSNRQAIIDDLVADAMELPAGQRRDFLLNHAPDPEAAAETLLLIQHGALLDEEDAARGMRGSATGERIGPYCLRWLLGSGSFGDVYLAIREDLGQRAAVKLLKTSLDASAQARFENEARLLASFDHPNITRLIDYGRSKSGQLFLVMELAEAGTLSQWVELNRPSVPQVLRLFAKICDAVQYAHSNLVIHRDIKPSNVLMDSRGEPKLADFGIVQLLGTLASASPASSALDAPAGTRAYASPEQFRGSTLTTASDVYSLGIMLRELLEGKSVLKREAGQGAEAKPNDSTSDDLQDIIRRCLQQNPQARYANAGELRDEIQAYLECRPVKAGRQDWIHLAGLFARRNKSAVAASVIALILVFGALGRIWRQNVDLEKTAGKLRAAVAARNDQIKQVMVAAEHFDQVQRAEYGDQGPSDSTARAALAEAKRKLRVDHSLDARFHAALCARALAEILLHADEKNQRLEGWNELNRAKEVLLTIRQESPGYIGVQKELAVIDGIQKELPAGAWTGGGLGFASERVPPKLQSRPESVRTAADARSARALADLWRSLAEPRKAAAAYDRAIQLFDQAGANGQDGLAKERNECVTLKHSIQ